MHLPDLHEITQASELVYEHMLPSPQLSWPLLNRRVGTEVWVKHENHNPTGAFKVRGGLIYINRLTQTEPECPGVVAATRGNHGQSVAFAAAKAGLRAVVVVPEGNSPDKNAAMQAYGAELIVHGPDFDASLAYARDLAEKENLHFMPSIDGDLIPGVATYAMEFFNGTPALDRIYIPIGLGSGILGVVAAKQALGLSTEIIGVVSAKANAYELSFDAGKPIATNSADTIADGLAVRTPSPDALSVILEAVSRVVTVEDADVLRAMGHLFTDTHNVAEGAGAAGVAAVLNDVDELRDTRVGVVLTGGNVNQALYRRALEMVAAD